MKQSEYFRMAQMETSYWWHVGRLRLIESYLSQIADNRSRLSILNVGCGTGGTVPLLEKYGRVDNVDTSPQAIAFMKQRGYNNVTKVSGETLPFKDRTYDIVVAFDVLEHIEEDSKALEEWKRLLKDDGALLITVPAYQWLWSQHDVALHHKRRYTSSRLLETAKLVGLKGTRSTYAFGAFLPLVAIVRLFRRQKIADAAAASVETTYTPVPSFVNWLCIKLLYAEAWLHRYIKIPFGTSVMVWLTKNNV